MRSKLNGTLVLALFGLFSVATACGDDGTNNPGGGDAGEAGEVGAGGSGGPGSGGSNTAGKSGGTAGNGGTSAGNGAGGDPATNGGNPSSDGGTSSGSGGESGGGPEPKGNGGESGSGTEPMGNGGESGSGAGGEGGGGPVGCTEITLGELEAIVTEDYARYAATITPNIGTAADDSLLFWTMGPPFDGGDTGTFDLTENGDDNYKTCSRCFLVASGDTRFFQSEGTLTIDPSSAPLQGDIDATVTNLKLVEVTIANDSTSTPVENGACLTVTSANIKPAPCDGFQCDNGGCIDAGWTCDQEDDCGDGSDELPNPLCVVPQGWECQDSFVGDGDCDCGCGVKDTDCTGTTDETECDYCSACTGNFALCPDTAVDSNDTTQCAD